MAIPCNFIYAMHGSIWLIFVNHIIYLYGIKFQSTLKYNTILVSKTPWYYQCFGHKDSTTDVKKEQYHYKMSINTHQTPFQFATPVH